MLSYTQHTLANQQLRVHHESGPVLQIMAKPMADWMSHSPIVHMELQIVPESWSSCFYLSVESKSSLPLFCITTLNYWLKKLAPLSQPIRSKTKAIATCSRTFSRASCRLHVFASSFDWFPGFPASLVIGQSDYFGFGFTTLISKLFLWAETIFK